jgi:hypothetical protein
MSAEQMDNRITRLNTLSERLLGEPGEVEYPEAEELLKTAGIDPARLKGTLYQRMLERSEGYSSAGKPLPPLLRKALDDLRPIPDRKPDETTLSRTARLAITRLLREIRELPARLNAGFMPAFTAAYRKRTELTARDKKVLDEVTEDLRNKAHE